MLESVPVSGDFCVDGHRQVEYVEPNLHDCLEHRCVHDAAIEDSSETVGNEGVVPEIGVRSSTCCQDLRQDLY